MNEFSVHRDYQDQYSTLEELPEGEWLVIITDVKGPFQKKGSDRHLVVVSYEEVVDAGDDRVPRGKTDYFQWDPSVGDFAKGWAGRGRWKAFSTTITEDDSISRDELLRACLRIVVTLRDGGLWVTNYLIPSAQDIADARDYREYRQKVTGGI